MIAIISKFQLLFYYKTGFIMKVTKNTEISWQIAW